MRASPFESMNIYEAPRHIAAKLTGGEPLSLGGMYDTIVNRGLRLSPEERDSWYQRLEAQVDDESGALAGALSVATNPWIWLAAVMTPSAGRALKASDAVIFNDAIRKSVVPATLRTGNAITPRSGREALRQMGLRDKELRRRATEMMGDTEDELIAALWSIPVKDVNAAHHRMLNRTETIRNAAVRDRVERYKRLAHAKLSGLDKTVGQARMEVVPRSYVLAKTADDNYEWVEVTDEAARARIWTRKRRSIQRALEEPPNRDQVLMAAADAGLDPAVVGDEVITAVGGSPGRVIQTGTITEEAMFEAGALDEAIEALVPGVGLRHVNAVRDMMGDRLTQLMFKDGEVSSIQELRRKFVEMDGDISSLVDPDKVQRLYHRSAGTHVTAADADLGSTAERLMSREVRRTLFASRKSALVDETVRALRQQGLDEATARGRALREHGLTDSAYLRPDDRLTYEEFLEDLTKQAASGIRLDAYMPRNSTSYKKAVFDSRGTFLRFEEVDERRLMERTHDGLVSWGTSGRTKVRTLEGEGLNWDPDSLLSLVADVQGLVGERGLREVTDAAGRGVRVVDTALEKGRMLRNRMMDPKFRGQSDTSFVVGEMKLDYYQPVRRYEEQTRQDIIKWVDRPSAAALNAWAEEVKEFQEAEEGFDSLALMERTGSPADMEVNSRTWFQDLRGGEVVPPGGLAAGDVLEANYHLLRLSKRRLGDREAMSRAAMLRDVLVPATLQTRRAPEYHHQAAAIRGLQAVGGRLRDTQLWKDMVGRSSALRSLDDRIDSFVASDSMNLASRFTYGMVGHLYATHLGLNLASVMLNMTQPFLVAAPWIGAREVLRAYPEALDDLQRYFRERVKYTKEKGLTGQRALNLTPDERILVAQRAGIDGLDETGILGDTLKQVDELISSEGIVSGGGNVTYWTRDAPLKVFEKAEWLNRLVTAKAARNRFLRARGAGSAAELSPQDLDLMRTEMRTLVDETQFSASPMNSPVFLLDDRRMSEGGSRLSALSHPYLRQFLTFPYRAVMAPLEGALRVGDRGTGTLPAIQSLAADYGRMLAISAVMHEGTKAVGLNIERGLAAEAVTGRPFGLEADEEGRLLNVQPPPALSIPYQLLFGDPLVKAEAFARGTVPGAVGIMRMMRSQDDAADWWLDLRNFQRTYADWDHPLPDGRVPVFKRDGTMVGYQKGLDIILKGIGFTPDSDAQATEMDRYLAKQREQIIDYRSRAMNALLSNRPSEARRIGKEFEDKYGLPLTFTNRQMTTRMRNRTVGRTERMLDRMDPTLRPQYQRMLSGAAARTGTTPEDFVREATASRRQRHVPDNNTLDPATLEQLRSMMADEEAKANVMKDAYRSFGGY